MFYENFYEKRILVDLLFLIYARALSPDIQQRTFQPRKCGWRKPSHEFEFPFFFPEKKKNFSCLRMLFSTRADIFGPVQRCEKVLRYYYYLVATLISSDISETYLYLESINSYLKLRINHCTLQRSNNLFSTEISTINHVNQCD